MENKSLITVIILLLATGVVFFFIIFLIKIRGDRAKLIKQKFKYGGLIISLTAIISSCAEKPKEIISCYKPALKDLDTIENIDYGSDTVQNIDSSKYEKLNEKLELLEESK